VADVQEITSGQEMEYRDHKGNLIFAHQAKAAPTVSQPEVKNPSTPPALPRPRSRAASIEVDHRSGQSIVDALVTGCNRTRGARR